MLLGPEIVVPLGGMSMIVAIVVGRPLVSAWAKKMELEAKRPALPPDVAQRLEHMEQSIDAIAVEIERISEGQRFTTKLLAESKDSVSLPSQKPSGP